MNELEKSIITLAAMLEQSSFTVFFTGAGLSTESGIPDFRSPGTGLWNSIKPIQFEDFVNSEEARKESWRRKFSNDALDLAEPNAGHKAIKVWFEAGYQGGVITQNVDNLHQRSGLADRQIVELHGNATYAACLSCGVRYELAVLRDQFAKNDKVLPCSVCGGHIKTATVSFGQSMPEADMERAKKMVESCSLIVVLGSSLTVYPAAAFPKYAKQIGASMVIVNREPTDQDVLADLVVHESIGDVMRGAVSSVMGIF